MTTVTRGDSLAEVVAAFLLVAATVSAAVGYGGLIIRRLKGPSDGALVVLAASFGTGAVGCFVLLAGHLNLLEQVPLALILAVGAVLCATWAPVRRVVRSGPSLLRQAWEQSRPLTVLCLGALVFLAVSATAAPSARDELDYHWASPAFWADHGEFVKSPFRFSNGAALAEIHYTVPAVFGLSTAAHLLHLAAAVLLCAGLAVVARHAGPSRLWAVAAVAAFPPVLLEASIAYNDILFAALCVASLCAVLEVPGRARWWVAAAIVAIAASVKLVALLVVPGLLVTAATVGRREGWAPMDWRTWLESAIGWCLRIGGALALAAVIWGLHTHAMTGHWFVSSGMYISSVNDDPLAPGRVPDAIDVVTFPFFWITTAVLGGREPYGGRTGIVVLLFLPVAVLLWRSTAPVVKRNALWLILVAAAWLCADIVLARTRFNIFAWLVLACGVLTVTYARTRVGDRLGRVLYALFVFAVFVGLADALRKVPFPG